MMSKKDWNKLNSNVQYRTYVNCYSAHLAAIVVNHKIEKNHYELMYMGKKYINIDWVLDKLRSYLKNMFDE